MKTLLLATAFGAAVSLAALAPAQAQTDQQAPGWRQGLEGLLNGNQQSDEQLHRAYERGFQNGYSRGRTDALRANRNGNSAPEVGRYDQGPNGERYGNNGYQNGGHYNNGPGGGND
jgi:hypothetical protein